MPNHFWYADPTGDLQVEGENVTGKMAKLHRPLFTRIGCEENKIWFQEISAVSGNMDSQYYVVMKMTTRTSWRPHFPFSVVIHFITENVPITRPE